MGHGTEGPGFNCRKQACGGVGMGVSQRDCSHRTLKAFIKTSSPPSLCILLTDNAAPPPPLPTAPSMLTLDCPPPQGGPAQPGAPPGPEPGEGCLDPPSSQQPPGKAALL